MPSSLLEQAEERLPSWHEKTQADVFCLVKAFVSDDALAQPALLVLPGCKFNDYRNALIRLAKPDAPCTLP